MKSEAEEYFNESRFVSNSFTEITETGFRSDMKNVFSFAEEFAESKLQQAKDRAVQQAKFIGELQSQLQQEREEKENLRIDYLAILDFMIKRGIYIPKYHEDNYSKHAIKLTQNKNNES